MHVLDHRDITGQIDLTRPQEVCAAVCDLLWHTNASVDRTLIAHGFETFSHLYAGTLPGYHGCETQYHDMQHALDVTLACARLLAGHEHAHQDSECLGGDRLTLGIIVALFHDAGYIRLRQDRRCWHGAQYTLRHVARGARLLSQFLARQGRHGWARRAVKLIHFTGYEIELHRISLNNPLDRQLGYLIGTADLIAQMADRVYLEKCRDYLYEEFELGGLTSRQNADGSTDILYRSGCDLLSKTPAFYSTMVHHRLDQQFHQGYRYLELLFDGSNPYLEAIERNMTYLQQVLDDGHLHEMLRRHAEPVLAPQLPKNL